MIFTTQMINDEIKRNTTPTVNRAMWQIAAINNAKDKVVTVRKVKETETLVTNW